MNAARVTTTAMSHGLNEGRQAACASAADLAGAGFAGLDGAAPLLAVPAAASLT